ncbi:hypothetical protein M1N64_01195 [Peptococcaceae bacterium]|nr:hypothetical protein [Peptococcaceae bacterium]
MAKPVIFYGPEDTVLEILKTVAVDQGLDYTVTSDASEDRRKSMHLLW